MLLTAVCFCAFWGLNADATGVATNLASSGSGTTPDVSADAKIIRLNQLAQSDSSNGKGAAESRLLLDELDKLGFDVVSSNGLYSVLSTKRSDMLIRLTSLQKGPRHSVETATNSTSTDRLFVIEIRKTRAEIAKSGGIPVWDGNSWTDGRRLALNNTTLAPPETAALVDLNYWEQNFGSLSVPEDQKGKYTDMGETSAVISDLKKRLARSGVHVELDNVRGVWMVRNDNAK